MNQRISWMLFDHDLRKVVDPYGGWPIVLSKDFELPEELVLQLDKLTCSRDLLTAARLSAREVYLKHLAMWLYMAWQHSHRATRTLTSVRTPFDSNVRWQDYLNPSWWDSHEMRQFMELFDISRDDVERYIETHRAEMPPLDFGAPSAPDSPPTHESPVPRRPLPNAGAGEIALPLPPSDEEDDE